MAKKFSNEICARFLKLKEKIRSLEEEIRPLKEEVDLIKGVCVEKGSCETSDFILTVTPQVNRTVPIPAMCNFLDITEAAAEKKGLIRCTPFNLVKVVKKEKSKLLDL